MKIIRTALILLFATSLFACTEECPEGPNSDSLFCHGGNNADDGNDDDSSNSTPDENGNCAIASEEACSDVCVNTQTSPAHCGGCDSPCPMGATCVAGGCECPGDQVACDGVCIDPNTDDAYCGASLDCQGLNAGEVCEEDYACTAGTCAATFISVGSLPKTNGAWYGVNGGKPVADAECAKLEPGAQVCDYAKLQAASAAGELINPTTTTAQPVTKWWTMGGGLAASGGNPIRSWVCTNNDNPTVPWTYPTADQEHTGWSVTVTPGTGALAAAVRQGCNSGGNTPDTAIPCCMP